MALSTGRVCSTSTCSRQSKRDKPAPENPFTGAEKLRRVRPKFSESDGMELKRTLRVPARFFIFRERRTNGAGKCRAHPPRERLPEDEIKDEPNYFFAHGSSLHLRRRKIHG